MAQRQNRRGSKEGYRPMSHGRSTASARMPRGGGGNSQMHGRGHTGRSTSQDQYRNPGRSMDSDGHRTPMSRMENHGHPPQTTGHEDYSMREMSDMERDQHSGGVDHGDRMGSSVDGRKEKKGLVSRAVSSVKSSLGFGDNAQVTFNQSDIRVIAETKNMARREDLRPTRDPFS